MLDLAERLRKLLPPEPIPKRVPGLITRDNEFGITIPEEFEAIRITPGADGGEPSFTLVTPSQWEITPDWETYISPTGETLSLAQMQPRLSELGFEGMIYDYDRDMLLPATAAQVAERERILETINAQLAELGLKEIVAPPGTPEAIGFEEYEERIRQYNQTIKERREEIDAAIVAIFPGTTMQDFQQLLADMTITEDMAETEATEAEQAQTEFLTAIRTAGRTPETEFLLSTIFPTARAEDIDSLFAEAPTEQPTAQNVLLLEPEWENIRTGEVITASEKAKRYPKGYEAELDEWALTNETARNYSAVFRVFGESLTLLPKQLAASILSATQGQWGASVVNKDWADRLISEAKTDINAFAQEVTTRYSSLRLPIPIVDLATLPQSTAFSLTSMGAGLAVGVPIALIPEPTPASRIAAWAAGTAASGAVAFSMSSYQIMQTFLEVKNDEMKDTLGRDITLEEEEKLKRDFSALAIKYGLWEAVPEALSNLAFAKILTMPLGNMVGRSIATKMLSKLVGVYGEELLTETITQKGQSDIEVQAGLRDERITWIEAFKEIAPQTFLLTTILGGTGQISVSAVNRIKKSLKQEIGDSPIYDTLKENITEDVFAEVEAEGVAREGMREAITRVIREERGGFRLPEKKPVTPDVIETGREYSTTVYRGAKEGGVPVYVGLYGKGTYYTTNREYAETYGVIEASTVSLKNPFVIKSQQEYDDFQAKYRLVKQEAVNQGKTPQEAEELAATQMREDFEAAGYDGVIARDIIERGDEVVVFDPKKSITAAIPKAEAVTPSAEGAPEARVTEITPEGEEILSTLTEAQPPPPGATRRVYDRIQFEPEQTGFKEKIRRGWHKFNVKMVDDLFALKKLTDQLKKGGVELSIQENPYLLARLLRGVTSKATSFLENGTFGKQFWKMEKGKAVPNYTGESLENILNEVKGPILWRDFSTYLTARRSLELSARDIETGIDVNDAKVSIAEFETKYKNFSALAQRVYKYQDNLLVYSQEMGLISNELLGKLRKYGNYVPFYRVFNELQSKGLMGKKMANIASPIKRIKGSEREIINPLESIVKNTYILVSAAERNQVSIALANLVDKNPDLADVFERVKTPMARVAQVSAKDLGVEVEGMTEAEEEQMVDIFRPSFFVSGDEVTVLIDGKKNYYKVDADLRDALLVLNRETLGTIGKILGAPARWLRAGATLSPDFMFRNPARDQLSAFAYSKYGFVPGIDFIRGLASMLKRDSAYQLFRMSGAEHSMLVSLDREYLQKTFKQVVEGKGFIEYVKNPMELFRIISEAGEKATRLGEFKKGIKSGAVPLEAGYSARVVTLDFAQAGTTAQALNTLIAFFNANIRGTGRLISSFKEQPIRTSAKVFVGITLPSIMLWMVNHDDDRWKEIPQWQKDLFWIVFVGDNIYRIPKPFELGILFGSIPERFLDWLVEKDPDLMKNVAQAVIEAGSPGFIPTAGLPILEWMTNYNFFRGRAIVPASRKAMPPELQYTRWTSEVSKKLGELLKLPPAQIDNLFFAWTGGLGRYAIDILDVILKKTGISPDIPEPSPTLADLPVIKAFVVRNPYGSSSEAVNDFYDFLEKYEAGEKYLKEMLIAGELDKYNKYKADHPELFFFADFDSEGYKEAIEEGETPKDVYYSSSARYLRRVARDLSELSKKEDLIYKDPDMSPEKKRQLIDEIEILKTDIARKAVNLLQMKEPTILQDMINEEVGRLGEVIEEGTPLSLEKTDIYNMSELNRKFPGILEGAKAEELKAIIGIDPLAVAWIEKEVVEKIIEPILNKQVKDIDFNLKEGVTFEDYYIQWQTGLVKNSPLDKLSRRQIELLRKYQASDNKKAFLQTLTDEEQALLTENPRQDYLRTHPKENAQLAVWGQAKILTKEAYNQFQGLLKSLDIPDSAIPELTLPPEGSIETHFTYEEMVSVGKHGSWEAQLLLLKDAETAKEAGVKSYAEWKGLTLSDTPVASLELKVKNRALFDTLDSYSDKDSPDYIADDKKRTEAVAKLRLDNPEWVDDTRRIEALEVGADDAPTDSKIVEAWVKRGNTVDEFGGGSSETKVWLLDNPEVHKWALANELLTDDGSGWNEPVLRINVKYREEDNWYNEGIPDKNKGIVNIAARNDAIAKERKDYLTKNPEYEKDRYRRDAHGIVSPTYEPFPKDQIETYVDYNTNPDLKKPLDWEERTNTDLWFEDDWYLIENEEFYNTMVSMGLWQEKDFSKVPTREVFSKYQEYLKLTTSSSRLAFRVRNPDLDAWGQMRFEWKPAVGRTATVGGASTSLADLEEHLAEMRKRLSQ